MLNAQRASRRARGACGAAYRTHAPTKRSGSGDGLIKVALAEAEARAGDVDRALAILGEALATSERTGHRAFDAELHRVRGEILLKRDPANPAPAEEALLTAIAVAKQQGTRSFRVRASLSLAKMYRSIPLRAVPGRRACRPRACGRRLCADTRNAGDRRGAGAAGGAGRDGRGQVRRAGLAATQNAAPHAAYGNAMILAHGYGARETSAAFERARDTATGRGWL